MKGGISEEVRALLRCPETGESLREATTDELEKIDVELSEGGFITADGMRIYPIQDGFPILIVAESIDRI